MSEIRANTISDAAGTGPIDLHKQSAAKVLAFFSTKGTVTLFQSLNVSTLTDTGAGSTVTNFVTSFDDDDYITTSISGDAGTSTAFTTDVGTRTAGSFNVITRNLSNSLLDCSRVSFSIHGDLA